MDGNIIPVNVNPRQPVKRPSKIKRFYNRLTSKLMLLLLLIVALAVAGYFGYRWHQSDYRQKHPDEVAQAQTQDLVDRVGQLMILPADETPTVATISDVSKLVGQSFFANAQNGDKVLIYSDARQAILYRPSTNQIVNIAPLNIDTTSIDTTTQ
jgi:hypothetical protein